MVELHALFDEMGWTISEKHEVKGRWRALREERRQGQAERDWLEDMRFEDAQEILTRRREEMQELHNSESQAWESGVRQDIWRIQEEIERQKRETENGYKCLYGEGWEREVKERAMSNMVKTRIYGFNHTHLQE
jgi:hypothetical protein